MTGDTRFRALLGEELWALVQTLGSPPVEVEPTTRLVSSRLQRASFQVQLEDGRSIKARRVADPHWGRRVQALNEALPVDAFPRVLARLESALLIQWIEGSPATSAYWSPSRIHEAGALLARLHCVTPRMESIRRYRMTPAGRFEQLERSLTVLVDAHCLSNTLARDARSLARDRTPAEPPASLVHGDFCAENVIVEPSGHFFMIDCENVAIDAADYDLARTWYRWPMSMAGRRAFLEGYRQHRDPTVFLDHRRYWLLLTLAGAASFRVEGGIDTAAAVTGLVAVIEGRGDLDSEVEDGRA